MPLCDFMSDKEVRSYFRIGVKILSKAKPDWHKKVKLRDSILMQSTSKCILARVYGDFVTGLDAIGELPDVWSRCGFAGEWYGPLWKEEIRKRRAKDNAKKAA